MLNQHITNCFQLHHSKSADQQFSSSCVSSSPYIILKLFVIIYLVIQINIQDSSSFLQPTYPVRRKMYSWHNHLIYIYPLCFFSSNLAFTSTLLISNRRNNISDEASQLLQHEMFVYDQVGSAFICIMQLFSSFS